MEKPKIAVVGLGYVGLPLAVAFAKHFPVIGFDINLFCIEELKKVLIKPTRWNHLVYKARK